VYSVAAPDVYCPDWADIAANRSGLGEVQAVHFLRDPFSMAVSSYLYHRQTPAPELWIRRSVEAASGFCEFNNKYLEDIITFVPGLEKDELKQVEKLCRQIVGGLPTRALSYADVLRTLETQQGLRLEAARCASEGEFPSAGDCAMRLNWCFEIAGRSDFGHWQFLRASARSSHVNSLLCPW
jgi:hypothetical protein